MDYFFVLTDKNVLLHQAIREGRPEIARKLLSEGAKINCRDINSSTPLHIAAENGDVQIAKVLLEFHADVCAKDKYSRTVLDSAFWNGNETLILALLEKTNNINISTNNRNDTPLHLASELCSPHLVKWLLERGAEVNAKKYRGKTPLHVASLRGNAEIAKILLNFGADFNCKDDEGDTALLIASRHGKEEVVNVLLNYNVDVNIRIRRGETALHLLVENKAHEETIRLLLSKGAKVNIGSIIDRTALHICAIYGQSQIAQTLLEFQANPNFQDANGQTPLHLACAQGNEGVIRVLLQYAANPNIMNELGKTPLHYAAVFGCSKIVELLLIKGANPNAMNIDGRCPLAYSVCEMYNHEIIHILLKFGADINCIDRYGLTPLHIAGKAGSKEMISLLLDLGADVNATDWDNRTPLDVALSVSEGNQGAIVTLANHIIMRKTLGLYVCEENLESLGNDEYLDYFQNVCQAEVDKMKKVKIGISNVSYHDVITKSIQELVKFARNPDIEESLTTVDYKSIFPLYGNVISPLIKSNFRNALTRKNLLDKGVQVFYVVFRELPKLPQNCIDKIFTYLEKQDVDNFIDAFNK